MQEHEPAYPSLCSLEDSKLESMHKIFPFFFVAYFITYGTGISCNKDVNKLILYIFRAIVIYKQVKYQLTARIFDLQKYCYKFRL